jgi:cbb3-type cytochrome oxidase maturation protein
MSVLYVALPVAILLGGAALIACLYCIRTGQYDEMESSSMRILIDEQPIAKEELSQSTAETSEQLSKRPIS